MKTPRATAVLAKGAYLAAEEIGTVTLSFDDRYRRRILLAIDGGRGEFLLDLPQAVRLAEGDGLRLESGGVVCVMAAQEPMLEVRAGASSLAQLAYHIGNRHLPAQIMGEMILIRQDQVIEDMLNGLGADCRKTLRPFSPEQGAYGRVPRHGHAHGRDDHHSHDDGHAHAHDG
ncbi:urease accessory protein UreE [Methylocella silvestris]|uniref:Urease accessory protein UreE n=1 Tax=Methylocella silvestris TaxID=199596 RepID=A0A2J7TDQ5_METSI|nr:urease accessory protein UreE [Methylocella silvestris]PNG24905.1 urease accessory protein UreE [Methylocella silvestris]